MFKHTIIAIALFALQLACVPSTMLPAAHADEKLTPHTMKSGKNSRPADADLSDFAWLQGAWLGEGLGAKCDETWSSPAGGCMLGTFRMVKDDELVFTEFFMLVRSDNGVVLKLKHFGPDLSGWEEKEKSVDFPLIQVKNKTAYFGGLTYQLQDDGSLKAYVAMKKKDGTYREGAFHFRRSSVIKTRPTDSEQNTAR